MKLLASDEFVGISADIPTDIFAERFNGVPFATMPNQLIVTQISNMG